MKKFLLVLGLSVTALFTKAQNTFPTPSGNVGIGTTSPAFPLQISTTQSTSIGLVNYSVGGAQSVGETSIYMGDAGSGINMIRASKKTNNTRALELWSEYGYNSAYKAADFYYNYLNFYTGNINRLSIDVNGNVGIGTNAASGKLQVFGTSVLNGTQANLDYNAFPNISYLANSASLLIGWNRTGGNGETDLIANRGAGGVGGYAFYDYTNSGSENLLLRIFANGNIGIGQSNPQNKLDVAGTIHSQAVKVDMSGWSDYVFKSNYNLLPLKMVESFINKYHHLLDMPSEREVVNKGVDLGAIVKLQQMKIEELTLYLIEKDKQIKSLQGDIKKIRSKIQM